MDKAELLEAMDIGREKFLDAIEGLEEEQLLQPGVHGDWTIKDIIAHLGRWEAELVKLLFQISQGTKPSTMHFAQANVDETNARWLAQDKLRALDLVLEDFHGVRNQTMRRVEEFTSKDLEDPNRYKALNGTPLWKYIAGDSFEHEAEHEQTIRQWRAGLNI